MKVRTGKLDDNYRAAHEGNAQLRNTFLPSMSKKEKMADGIPRRLCVSPFNEADFCRSGRVILIKSSGEQIWKSIWNEHKVIAWRF